MSNDRNRGIGTTIARRLLIGLVLVAALGLVASARAQVPPNVVVPTVPNPNTPSLPDVGNSHEGVGSVGGVTKPRPTPRIPVPTVAPRVTTPAPTTRSVTQTPPVQSTTRTVRSAPRVVATGDDAPAAARRKAQAIARRVARRDRRLRERVLQLTQCLSEVGDAERAVLLLRAHPTGAKARPRAQVAKLLDMSTRGVTRMESRGLRRLRTLEREGTCAPRETGTLVADARRLERAVTLGVGAVKTSAPVSSSKPSSTRSSTVAGGTKASNGGGSADSAGVKGAAASSLATEPAAAAASGDWLKQAFTIAEILLLFACAAWVGRAVWRVL